MPLASPRPPDASEFLAIVRSQEMARTMTDVGQPVLVITRLDEPTLAGTARLATADFSGCVFVDAGDDALAQALDGRGLRVIDRSDLTALAWSRSLP